MKLKSEVIKLPMCLAYGAITSLQWLKGINSLNLQQFITNKEILLVQKESSYDEQHAPCKIFYSV